MEGVIRDRQKALSTMGLTLLDRPVSPGSWVWPLVLAGLLGYQGWQLWRSPLPFAWLSAIDELIATLLYLALSYQLRP